MKNKKIKIAVASGKGGTGKSMIVSTLSYFFHKEKKIIALDCDVDTPNLAIWLNEISNLQTQNFEKSYKISTSLRPKIDFKKCNACGICLENCHFSALKIERNKLQLNPFLCEGCGVCEIVCPQDAIRLTPIKNAEIKIKKTKYGFFLIWAQLVPGESGSGKIVDVIKNEAEKFDYDVMIIDSPPGIGCPVISALRSIDFSLLVCEPTLSGFFDLKRILKIVEYFKIPFWVVINKWDLNKRITKKIEREMKRKIIGKISYNKKIIEAISDFVPIFETELLTKKEIKKIFEKLKKILW